LSPLCTAQNFSHRGLPVAVITSRADWHVPPELARRVAYALEQRGVRAVARLELATSPHSSYATHNAADRAAYAAFLQALYQRHLAAGPAPAA